MHSSGGRKHGGEQIQYTSRFARVILAQGHANLLCAVPILTDDPRRESETLVLPPRCRCAAPATRFCTAHVGEPLACAPFFFLSSDMPATPCLEHHRLGVEAKRRRPRWQSAKTSATVARVEAGCLVAEGLCPWPRLARRTHAPRGASVFFICCWEPPRAMWLRLAAGQAYVGSCSQANYLLRNSAMDDSIGGS